MSIKVVVTEQLACGHDCDIEYPMEEWNFTLKTGPLTSINPERVFPDMSLLFSSLNRTLELTGKRGDVQFIGIIARDGCFHCAQCGTLLLSFLPRGDE